MSASKLLTPQDIAAVERAIGEAEQSTAAELVVVLAPRSGRYDRAEDVFGVLLGLLAVALAWLLWQDLVPRTGDWTGGNRPALGLIWILVLFVFWMIVGVALATAFPVLARPLIPRGQIEAEVRRRGFEAFHTFRVGHTAGRTGVLIFVSLLERTALVSGDDAINARLPRSTWDEACRAIAQSFRSGKREEGLVRAISLCGAELAKHLPRRPGDPACQLPNTVHFLE